VINNFEFLIPTKIIFGKGTEKTVGEQIEPFGKNVLIHFGGNFVKDTGLLQSVTKSLEENNIHYEILDGVLSNPRLSLIRKGIQICREHKIDFILAIGGGSAIDSAKAIGIGTPYDGDVWDFFKGKLPVTETLPVGSILTIPSAGSECSNGTVITNEDGFYKRSVNYEIIRPKFAILNPELSYTLPAYQTACGITDMISHVMENYFTNVERVDLVDKLCEATIKTVIKNAAIVMRDPNDYEARAQIMWSANFAHAGMLSTGRVGDWGSHNIEHELSAQYDIAHGAGLAILFPAWMKYVYKHDMDRFVQFAVQVWDVDFYSYLTKEEIIFEGIKRMTRFFKDLGMPVTLEDAGIDESHFTLMAKKCVEDGPVGNFVKLDYEDVLAIYKIAAMSPQDKAN